MSAQNSVKLVICFAVGSGLLETARSGMSEPE